MRKVLCRDSKMYFVHNTILGHLLDQLVARVVLYTLDAQAHQARRYMKIQNITTNNVSPVRAAGLAQIHKRVDPVVAAESKN